MKLLGINSELPHPGGSMIRKSAMLIVLALFVFSIPAMACNKDKTASKTGATTDQATVKSADANGQTSVCTAKADAQKSACSGMRASQTDAKVQTADAGSKSECSAAMKASSKSCDGVPCQGHGTCSGMKAIKASYATASGSQATFQGMVVRVDAHNDMPGVKAKECSAHACNYAIKTSDGKVIELQNSEQSNELANVEKYRDKNVKVQGIFYADANKLEVESLELDATTANR